MKVLLLGGTGVLSSAVLEACLSKEFDTYVLNRGHHNIQQLPLDHILISDLRDSKSVAEIIGSLTFDVIVDFLSYTPTHLSNTLSIFNGHMKHYVFISSATVYSIYNNSPITEDRELVKSGWEYAINKAICEKLVAEKAAEYGFFFTIVRPYVTYGDTRIPFALCKRHQQWSLVNRIKNEKPILMWDDGMASCPITHVSDFAKGLTGLLGNPMSNGKAYHITSDEVRTWNDVIKILGNELGKEPKIFYLSSQILEKEFPMYGNELTGDKARNYYFDNTRIKEAVPDFSSLVSLEEGLNKTLRYYQQTPQLQSFDIRWDADMDRVISKYATDPIIKKNLIYIPSPNDSPKERMLYILHRYTGTYNVIKIAYFCGRFVKALLRKLQN